MKGLAGWICDKEFQIYSPIGSDSFSLHVTDCEPVIRAFAGDINRIAIAPFETITFIISSRALPRSAAWLIIKTYYAAFFAAHALVRMLGTSCILLTREQRDAVAKIADLYGYPSDKALWGGLYTLTFDATARRLAVHRLRSLKSGPHEAFWGMFRDLVKARSNEVLKIVGMTLGDRQLVSMKLDELVANLSFGSSHDGQWLSAVRNEVNYEQKFGTWFPYAGQKRYSQELFGRIDEWKSDPIAIDLVSHEGRDLRRFQATCNFIVSLCRVVIADMARRCPSGADKSFHSYGSLALLNLLRLRV